jgi:hypothetical protein
VTTGENRTWVHTQQDPTWLLLEGSAGFDLGVAVVPHHLGEVVASLGELEEAGEFDPVELEGRTARHLRGRTSTGLVVDAWVGADDGWLRRLRWLPPAPADDRDGTTHGEVTARLRDHGRSIFLGVPEDWIDLAEAPEEAWPPFVAGPAD